MAKTRKAASAKKKTSSANKSAAKKPTGGKKKAARGTRQAASAKAGKELDLRPLKKQIKAHVEMLSRARSGDKRISEAIASLRRVHMELDANCDPTMTIPLA